MEETKRLEFKHCPFCDGEETLTMRKVKKTRIKETKIVKGVFEVWTCSKCGEEFFHHWDITTKPIPPTTSA